jgi:hypothetical protein
MTNYAKQDPYQAGIDAYLTLEFATPIAALAKHSERFNREERLRFAEGFWYADETLSSKK